jgi:hypothetical protein
MNKNMPHIILFQTLEQRLCETNLSILVNNEDGVVTTECPELELFAMGNNLNEAIKNISISISIFVQDGIETGELKDWLVELGWEITESKLEYNGSLSQEVKYSKNEQKIILPIKEILIDKHA